MTTMTYIGTKDCEVTYLFSLKSIFLSLCAGYLSDMKLSSGENILDLTAYLTSKNCFREYILKRHEMISLDIKLINIQT